MQKFCSDDSTRKNSLPFERAGGSTLHGWARLRTAAGDPRGKQPRRAASGRPDPGVDCGHKERAGSWLAAAGNAVPPRSPGPSRNFGLGSDNPRPGPRGGQCAFPRDLATRPPFASLHLPQPAPCTLTVGAQPPGSSIYCLLFTAVLERALGSVLRGGGNMGRWAQPEFPSRERVRGILNGTPDAESSDRPSSDYSPLAPPLLPPAHLQICIKKAKKTLAGPQLRLTLLPRVGAHLELRAGFQRGAQRRTSPAQSPARPASRR